MLRHFLSFVLVPMLVSLSTALYAANEIEPNNTFAEANFVAQDTTVNASFSNASDIDYFIIKPGFEGTITIYYTYTGGSSNADFYINTYNKSSSNIGSKSNLNTTSLSDSLKLYCRQADTMFLRFNGSEPLNYQLRYSVAFTGTSDAEPNNSYEQATFFQGTSSVSGRVGYASSTTDIDDYYFTVLPEDGTLRILVDKINTSNTTGADFYFYAYNKTRNLIGSYSSLNTPLGVLPTDTLDIFCRAADTVFFRMNSSGSSGCYSYTMRYEMLSTGVTDTEPNNSYEQATFFPSTSSVSGRIGYASTTTDIDDYFFTVLPQDGTLRILVDKINTSNTTGADFYFYAYNKTRNLIGSYSSLNTPLGVLPTDTLDIFCRAADTVFFRMNSSGSSGCYSYTMRYEMLTTGVTDAEPNNSFDEATFFSNTSSVSGKVGYASSTTDESDYFFSVLPQDGTLRILVDKINTSNSTGADFYFYAYNKNRSQIDAYSTFNTPLGVLPTDTLDIFCRAADTVFFRIQGFSGCYSYTLRYEMLSAGVSDPEPNNSEVTATNIKLEDTLRGNIGYNNTTADPADYFRFVSPGITTVTAYLTYKNTSNSTGADFYFNLQNKNGSNRLSRSYINQALGESRDTILMTCLPNDTLLFRFTSSGCFQYNMTFSVKDETPSVDIFSARMGNTLSFVADNRNTDQTTWNFGDGTTSALKMPVKTFPIGFYKVLLDGRNSRCNLSAKDSIQFSIDGIEYYTPLRVGKDGNIGFFNLRLFGGGLDTNAIVRLKNGSNIITPIRTGSPASSELNLVYSFAGTISGTYDIEITLSGGYDTIIKNGFQIFDDIPGYKINVRVQGPTTVRTGTWTNYTLEVHNNRARIANHVVACLVVPEGVETNLKDVFGSQTGRYVVKGSEYNKLTIPFDYFNNVYFEGSFNPNIDTIAVNYNDVYQYRDQLMGVGIDSLFDRPFKGTVYQLLIPLIGANSTYTIQFKLKSNSSASLSMFSYALPYNLRQNPLSARALEGIHQTGLQAAALAEMAPNPALKAVGKSAGYIDAGSQILFTEYFDWYYGVNNADAEFYAKQSMSLAGTYASSKISYGGKFNESLERINTTNNAVRLSTQRIIRDSEILTFNQHPAIRDRLIREILANRAAIEKLGPNVSDLEKQAAIYALKNWSAGQGINLTNAQLQEFLFGGTEEPTTNHPENINVTGVRSVTSFDPNEIYGPAGYNTDRFIKKDQKMSYLVTFENVDTAQAPAQIVKIDVQLDTQKFDLTKTWLSDITIGGNVYFFEQDRNTYFRDVDLRPAKNMIVRVNATLNPDNGKIRWMFVSLDPATMDLITDPEDGFLPPNVSSPEGEGSVSFLTELKPSVVNNEQVSAFASIIFDNNEPIITSTWRNRVDDQKPQASLAPNAIIESDSVIVLTASGLDNESGLTAYRLFVKVNDGNWWKEGLHIYPDQEIRIWREPSWTYSFYIEGIDSVGNRQTKTPNAELVVSATTSIRNNEKLNSAFAVFPNPAKSEVYIMAESDYAQATIAIYDMSGKLISSKVTPIDAGQIEKLNVADLASGLYIIHLSDKKGFIGHQKVLIMP